jgi:hypothetical protein
MLPMVPSRTTRINNAQMMAFHPTLPGGGDANDARFQRDAEVAYS